jgi:hypothetical protein
MINNEMNTNKSTTNAEKPEIKKKPDENSGVYFSSSVKIYDPETNEVFVQKRGDD